LRAKKRYVLVKSALGPIIKSQLRNILHPDLIEDKNLKIIPLSYNDLFAIRLSPYNASKIKKKQSSGEEIVTIATSGSLKKLKSLAKNLSAERSNNARDELQ
jgi:hypothetical protein